MESRLPQTLSSIFLCLDLTSRHQIHPSHHQRLKRRESVRHGMLFNITCQTHTHTNKA